MLGKLLLVFFTVTAETSSGVRSASGTDLPTNNVSWYCGAGQSLKDAPGPCVPCLGESVQAAHGGAWSAPARSLVNVAIPTPNDDEPSQALLTLPGPQAAYPWMPRRSSTARAACRGARDASGRTLVNIAPPTSNDEPPQPQPATPGPPSDPKQGAAPSPCIPCPGAPRGLTAL